MQSPSPSTTIFHLEMRDRQALRPKVAPPGFEVAMITPPSAELNRQFYLDVGAQWQWTDRLQWSQEDWRQYAHRAGLTTWVGQLHGQSIGYFELDAQSHGDIEIAYFGLLPQYIGRGLGGALLTAAVERAWAVPDVQRVWLHTCTKDHQHALDNYRKRGFEIFKTQRV